MSKFMFLTIGFALIATLGLLVGAQSEPLVRHAAPPEQLTTIYAPGRIEGASPSIELRSYHRGTVEEILVREGETVAANQPLLLIDSASFRNGLALARAELATAEAELKKLENGAHILEQREAEALYSAKLATQKRAQLNLERVQRLRADGAVPQKELDDQLALVTALQAESNAAKSRLDLLLAPPREDELEIARSQVEVMASKVAAAELQLERAVLKAPVAGKILQLNVEKGELSSPDAEIPAIVMVDISKYHVRAFVEELDAPRIKIGMPAEVSADGLEERLLGEVVRVSPHMTKKQLWSDRPTERFDTKSREVWIELDQSGDHVIGLRMDVTIDISGTHNWKDEARAEP